MATATGVVTFEAQGQQHALRFTTNALCLLEDQRKLDIVQVAQELAFAKDTPLGVSATTLRVLFWAGVGGGELTLSAAGDLVDAIGKARAVALAIEAFDAAFPPAEPGDDENPPTAAG